MVRYAKCPRCELNYIDADKQQFCDVCLKEMKGEGEDPYDEDDELMELCPKCGENMMRAGEEMCDECKKKMEYEQEEDVGADLDDDEEWRNYLDDETEETDDLGLGEEFGAEFADDEEEDFEYVTGDDIYKYAGDDDDDDDDDDEQKEDDDF